MHANAATTSTATATMRIRPGTDLGRSLMGPLYTPWYAGANRCGPQPRGPPSARRSVHDLHEGDHAALHMHRLVAVEEPGSCIVGRALELDPAHVGIDIDSVLD